MLIRPLDKVADHAAVLRLFHRAADYVDLESGMPPDAAMADAFFSDAPPGIDPATSLRLGMFDGDDLVAIAELAFGHPDPADAFIGLLLIAQSHRGQGLGTLFLDHLMAAARSTGANRLLIAVLDANPRARAFWQRHGFAMVLTTPPGQIGRRTHIRHRMQRPL